MKNMSYKDLFSLSGKTALVTGGAGLIGREIVKALHEFGAAVYIADVHEDKVAELLNDKRIKYVHLDITSEESIHKAVDSVVNDSGNIDIFVNSAYPRTHNWGLKFENIPLEAWKQNVDSQLGGCFCCCQKVAEIMKSRSGGSIINLGSMYGVVGPDFTIYEGTEMTMPAAYSAIKGGTIALTRYLATYYAKYKIRANAISPGGIFDNQAPAFVEKYSRKTPLGRMGYPEDIAGAVVFLASDASSYVTGHNLMVDGGWTAQ
jgi:NAD(P)-dependent dehydrogenase (short-subunit alcohol dehydrogenase family)